MFRRTAPLLSLTVGAVLGLGVLAARTSRSQEPSSTSLPNVRLLDREAERLQKDYIEDLSRLAKGYEDAGDADKATQTLRKILEISPQAEGVKEKLEELANRAFDTNAATVEIDIAKGWVPTGLRVEEGQPIRLEAQGSYKYIVNASLGPEGFSTRDPKVDMADRIASGQLMGWVVPDREPAPMTQRRRQEPPDLGRPFPIGAKTEVTPDKTGQLVLRVNIPPGTSSNGRLRVKVSGHFSRQ